MILDQWLSVTSLNIIGIGYMCVFKSTDNTSFPQDPKTYIPFFFGFQLSVQNLVQKGLCVPEASRIF